MGKNHVAIAIALVAANLLVFREKNLFDGWLQSLSLAFGVIVGALLPDVDADDSKVLHGSGIRQLKRLDPIVMAAGYLTKAVVYVPLGLVFRGEHRGIMHSLAGAVASGAFWWIVLLAVQGAAGGSWAAVLATGVFAGYIIHLAEDSFTRSGVAWLKPLSNKRVCGQAVTGHVSEDLVAAGFFAVAAAVYLIGKTIPQPTAVFLPLLTAGLVLVYFFMINPVLFVLRLIPRFS